MNEMNEKDKETYLRYFPLKFNVLFVSCFWLLQTAYLIFLSFNSLTSNEIILPTYMSVIRYIKCSLQCLAHRRSSVIPLPTSFHWLKFSPTKCIEMVRREGERTSGKAIEVRVVKRSECHRKSLAVYLCRWKNTKTGYHWLSTGRYKVTKRHHLIHWKGHEGKMGRR